MSVEVGFNYPKELLRNATVRQALQNVALFVRDLWLARCPYSSGDYARGLQQGNSISISNGKLLVTNRSKHAIIIEKGFRSFNIGLAILNKAGNVQVSKDGNRYKFIKIPPQTQSAYRKSSVSQNVVSSFTKAMPIGMPITKLTKYGGLKQYQQRRSLARPLKGRKQPGGSTVLCISEKAIKADPKKWQMPAREGRKLAEKVQQEARPYVVAALKYAVKQEQDRQLRSRGVKPSWSPNAKKSLTMIPAQKVGTK